VVKEFKIEQKMGNMTKTEDEAFGSTTKKPLQETDSQS
jgi:hypothetical protein